MQSVTEIEWDVVISGTGLQQSLLALALSRSNKKVLHVDRNEYYGGAEAAFSLQEVEEWAVKVNAGNIHPFSNASITKSRNDDETTGEFENLSYSRAYTLALSPQIIYSRSKLLSQLVSSKVYRQLEFQAVGSWWLFDVETSNSTNGSRAVKAGGLRRIPNGREDIFSDNSIDVRSKRSLMKFLKFVVEYDTQTEVWQSHAEEPLPEFLSIVFNLPPILQTTILALTLSIDLPAETTVRYSLPRIARHLTSIGVFGPGFGAVIPKWGGSSEIAQVACRAGAVGGSVYILGTGVKDASLISDSNISITLTNDEAIRTKAFVNSNQSDGNSAEHSPRVSKMIAVVSSDLASLFNATVEGGPIAAASVIAFPSLCITIDGQPELQPVFVMAHSSDAGECPAGQCVLYASSSSAGNSKARLEAAISLLITCTLPDASEEGTTRRPTKVLYNIYYEQRASLFGMSSQENIHQFGYPFPDLAFDDTTLDDVEDVWKAVMRHTAGDEASRLDQSGPYMVFEERGHIGDEEEHGAV